MNAQGVLDTVKAVPAHLYSGVSTVGSGLYTGGRTLGVSIWSITKSGWNNWFVPGLTRIASGIALAFQWIVAQLKTAYAWTKANPQRVGDGIIGAFAMFLFIGVIWGVSRWCKGSKKDEDVNKLPTKDKSPTSPGASSPIPSSASSVAAATSQQRVLPKNPDEGGGVGSSRAPQPPKGSAPGATPPSSSAAATSASSITAGDCP